MIVKVIAKWDEGNASDQKTVGVFDMRQRDSNAALAGAIDMALTDPTWYFVQVEKSSEFALSLWESGPREHLDPPKVPR